MKTILVFKNNEFFKMIKYKTKKEALINYKGFKKKGMLNPETAEIDKSLTFELI